MEFNFDEEQIHAVGMFIIRAAVVLIVLYVLWIFLFQNIFSAINETLKKDALAKAEVSRAAICNDLDSFRKLQQDFNSTNPFVVRIRALLATYNQAGLEFNESRCG
jgi:hypothetical protein